MKLIKYFSKLFCWISFKSPFKYSQVKKKILSRVWNIASSLRHKSFWSTPASPKREYMTQDWRKEISNLAVKILHHIQSGHVCEKQLKEISKYKEFNAVFSLLVRFKYNKQENEIERKIDKEKIMFELSKILPFITLFHIKIYQLYIYYLSRYL